MAIGVAKVITLGAALAPLQGYCTNAKLVYGNEMIDITALGAAGGRIFGNGLSTYTLELELQEDYASAKVDATLFGFIGTALGSSTLAVTVGASTITYAMAGLVLENYDAVGLQVGELAKVRATFKSAGALTRA
jgi:hypothetical protein